MKIGKLILGLVLTLLYIGVLIITPILLCSYLISLMFPYMRFWEVTAIIMSGTCLIALLKLVGGLIQITIGPLIDIYRTNLVAKHIKRAAQNFDAEVAKSLEGTKLGEHLKRARNETVN